MVLRDLERKLAVDFPPRAGGRELRLSTLTALPFGWLLLVIMDSFFWLYLFLLVF